MISAMASMVVGEYRSERDNDISDWIFLVIVIVPALMVTLC